MGATDASPRRGEELKHRGTAHAWSGTGEREGCLKKKEEEKRKGSKL